MDCDDEGFTALLNAAVWQTNTKIFELLIDAGANINAKTKDGNNLFHNAALNKEEIIAKYISVGFNTSDVNNAGDTCLEKVLLEGQSSEVLKVFLNKMKLEHIFLACLNNNPEILNLLIKYYKSTSKELLKALVLLISSNNTQEHIKLSKLKVFINYSTPINSFYNGKTPLMYAAEYCNSTSVIKVLLENDAIITLRSTEGKTAFDYAKENDNLIHDEVYWSLNKN